MGIATLTGLCDPAIEDEGSEDIVGVSHTVQNVLHIETAARRIVG